MQQNPTVYLAGPIQHADDDGRRWRSEIQATYDSVDWASPHDGYDTPDDYDDWEPAEIVATDRQMIRQSDGLLVRYEKVATWGTPREHEYATTLGLPVFVWCESDQPSPWVQVDVECVSSDLQTVVDEIRLFFDSK